MTCVLALNHLSFLVFWLKIFCVLAWVSQCRRKDVGWLPQSLLNLGCNDSWPRAEPKSRKTSCRCQVKQSPNPQARLQSTYNRTPLYWDYCIKNHLEYGTKSSQTILWDSWRIHTWCFSGLCSTAFSLATPHTVNSSGVILYFTLHHVLSYS